MPLDPTYPFPHSHCLRAILRPALLAAAMACFGLALSSGTTRAAPPGNAASAPGKSASPTTPLFVDRSPHHHGFADLGGVTLHFLDWGGQGPWLLLIPGLGNTAHTFDEFAPTFTDRFRVVGLTLRGHGQSDKPPSGYDTATLVEDVRAFMDLLGAKTASVVGFSIGSDVITGLAEKHSERVERLVYLDEASDSAELVEAERFAIVPPGLMAQKTRAQLMEKYWLFIEGGEVWSPAMAADMHFGQPVGPSGRIEPALAEGLEAQFIRGKAQPNHRAIKVPVLALFSHGYVWATVKPELREELRAHWNRERERHAERFRRLVPGAEVHLLEGGAHPLHIQKSAEVQRLTRRFLLK